ncbi:MerR family transcriptional regulator [Spirillospora sp. NPDC049652]
MEPDTARPATGIAGVLPRSGTADGGPPGDRPDDELDDKLNDEDYPAYSMGRAAELLDVTPAFLRQLDAAKLFVPQRSAGGHRRYSRYQLRLAQRARDLVDQGTALDAACRIIILEDQLAEAQRINARLQRRIDQDTGRP